MVGNSMEKLQKWGKTPGNWEIPSSRREIPTFPAPNVRIWGQSFGFLAKSGIFFQPSAGIWGILDPSQFWVLFLHFQPHFHPFYPQFSPHLCRSPQTFCFFPPNRGIPRKFRLLRSQNRGFLPKNLPKFPLFLFFSVSKPHHFPFPASFFGSERGISTIPHGIVAFSPHVFPKNSSGWSQFSHFWRKTPPPKSPFFSRKISFWLIPTRKSLQELLIPGT